MLADKVNALQQLDQLAPLELRQWWWKNALGCQLSWPLDAKPAVLSPCFGLWIAHFSPFIQFYHRVNTVPALYCYKDFIMYHMI